MTRQLGLHLWAFVLPLYTLLFVWTAPHASWATSLPWLVMIPLAIGLDAVAGPSRAQPEEHQPHWGFDAILLGLVAIQTLSLVGLVRVAWLCGFGAADTWVAAFLVGSASGYSAIVNAHELIHRTGAGWRLLGRFLLAGVLYEHFFTEHVRGHHKRVGTPEDPATARYGERYWGFLVRTVPAQLRSAWALEVKRVGATSAWDPRLLRSRVLHGLVVEWGFAIGLLAALGPAVFTAWVAQAAWAIMLLEAVNFIEHWGLVRRGRTVSTMDSWDAESWFTYRTLVGLSRHADHHAHAARPYQDLRWFPESPKMPWGYYATAIGAIFVGGLVVPRLEAELRNRKLGPFAEVAAAAK